MKIPGINIKYGEPENQSHIKMKPTGNDFTVFMSAASKQIGKQEDGNVLGITMLKEPGTNRFWGIKAKYASGSTHDNPVIYVETNYGGKMVSYNINIHKVDPNNASRIEIFALSCYADDIGIGDNSTFGTYNTIHSFEEMANHNGYIDPKTGELNIFEQFQNVKLNWAKMCQKVTDLLYECNDVKQYKKGLEIIDMFSKYLGN